jgi:hypothetical protein
VGVRPLRSVRKRVLAWAVVFLGCSSGRGSATQPSQPQVVTAERAATPTEAQIDLAEIFRSSLIDTQGPVVDLGERQATTFLASSATMPTEVVNGDSWVSVGTRLRLRVPLEELATGGIATPPTSVRMRIRRATSRGVAVIVDGLLVRASSLPQDGAPSIVDIPVSPERFTRPTTDIELRLGTPRPIPGVVSPVAIQIDWIHLAHGAAPPARVADLLNDVSVEHTPRRALTFYSPTRLSSVMILPTGAVWTASLAAEGPRGARPPAPVTAVLRAEADSEEPVETRVTVTPNEPWRDTVLDLSRFANRPVRLTLAAEGEFESRLAVANPMLRYHPWRMPASNGATNAPSPIRQIVLIVVRGLRSDRFLPVLSPRLTANGFARMMRGGTIARAQSPALREFTALISTTTGLAADVHHVSEITDALDEDAPTLMKTLQTAGIRTRAYTDDVAWVGSGADANVGERVPCPGNVPVCAPGWMFTAVADGLNSAGNGRSVSMIVTRAGVLPLDPTAEDITVLDPNPYEGTMTPSRTALYGLRTRPLAASLTQSDQDRLSLLYDASMLAVDRGIALILDRIRDRNLESSTAVIVVGDRGTALGEERAVGDGPFTMQSVAETVIMAYGPGFSAQRVDEVAGSIDAAATVLERLGVEIPNEMEGISLGGLEATHDRTLSFVATQRWELGLRFGNLVALPRAFRDGGGIGLFARTDDPLSQTDVSSARPIARGLAEAALATRRPGAGRRLYQPVTRVVPPALDALLRFRR